MKLKERDKLHSKLYPLKFLLHLISILFGVGLIIGIGYYIGIQEFFTELKKIQIIALVL